MKSVIMIMNKMKNVKLYLIILLAGLFSITMNSCKKDCSGEDPRARIINNGTDKASVQIKTSGGNTVNINNVDPGTASSYSSYEAGHVTFTITVKNIAYVKIVDMATCHDYDIAIDANNTITSSATGRD